MPFRHFYRSIVPEPVRAELWKARRRADGVVWPPSAALRTVRHEWGWMTSDRKAIHTSAAEKFGVPPSWVFMLGVNNSGTTLFLNIVEMHPDIGSLGGEGQYHTRGLDTPESLGIPRIWTQELDVFRWTEDEHPARALRAYYDWMAAMPADAPILFEKSPPNTIRSRWLQSHFHPSQFIATFRHPYAVCEGMQRRGGYPIADCARHWDTANRILLDDLSSLNEVFLFTYESFCEDPETTLEDIASFLELDRPFPADDLHCVGSHSMEGRTHGIQNMNARSVERLSKNDLQIIDDIAGTTMQRLGYEQGGKAALLQ